MSIKLKEQLLRNPKFIRLEGENIGVKYLLGVPLNNVQDVFGNYCDLILIRIIFYLWGFHGLLKV